MKTLFMLPNRKIVFTIPITIILGILVGSQYDTKFLKDYVLIVSILMVYPLMIGLKVSEVFNLKYMKLLKLALVINFTFIPLVAYLLGCTFLQTEPDLFAGLAIVALLPTGNMTIAFTMLAKGNVPASIQLTVVGLLSGALLAPWYLLAMVGKYVPVDIVIIMQTILLVVFVPLLAGLITYQLIMKKVTEQTFKEKIKPILPGFTAYGMIYIIFTSISINANRILADWHLLVVAIGVLLAFYIINFSFSLWLGYRTFPRENGITLVYGTALRNLSIGLGIAVTAFGANAALMVALCFLFQQQFAILLAKYHGKLYEEKASKTNAE
ncbi:hypothetical protein BHU72_10160 [Desulfuribacillus stibiiarsenatis]|uniref:Bile acid:sodium symporter n=1 Tax=Desulfuribacillus stibiiarsenatis TaxID=1390249 RepID=A0A1E5L962_9FIRM|nr:hypothetical protein BHU72_10160 [Desulfuribacillus stibiiarsenatis]